MAKTMHGSRVDLNSQPARSQLLKMIRRLFALWELSRADQCILLGHSPENSSPLNAIPDEDDFLNRVGWLLRIHHFLRLLYPFNPEICYSWIKIYNSAFNNQTPLEAMKHDGIIGIIRVAQYLEQYAAR